MTFVLVDTNLLVLPMVGRTPGLSLASHKRTRSFDGTDLLVSEELVAS